MTALPYTSPRRLRWPRINWFPIACLLWCVFCWGLAAWIAVKVFL